MTMLPASWISGVSAAAALIAALGFGGTLLAPTPAKARVVVGFGFGFPIGFPGYYYPPYPYYPPPPPPYYYPPPPSSPPPGYYQPSAAYPPAGSYAPSGSSSTPPITYTPRPGWTNAQGEYCREYKSTQGWFHAGPNDLEPPVGITPVNGGYRQLTADADLTCIAVTRTWVHELYFSTTAYLGRA